MGRLAPAAFLALLLASCGGGGGGPPTPETPSATAPTETPDGNAGAIEVEAETSAFDTDRVTVAAGSSVRIDFKNRDSLPHNFAVYESEKAQQEIFTGDIITGPQEIVYAFQAPSQPGEYLFRCDVHPTQMKGAFIVE